MKKTIFLFSLVAGLFTANAQTATPTPVTAGTTLNIKLKPFQTLVVNHSEVNLNFENATDYTGGVTATQADHLNVYSTGPFEISVKADETALTTTSTQTGNLDITVGDITITATKSAANEVDVTMAAVTLSDTLQPLITTTAGGGFNEKYNVTYGADGDYINHYLDGATGGDTTYSVGVTYSLVTK